MEARPRIHLVCGGRHDPDHARLELLRLIARDERCQTSCAQDFRDTSALEEADLLITYLDNVIPSSHELASLSRFMERGGRWFALHGTPAITRFRDGPPLRFAGCDLPGPLFAPDLAPEFMALIGCRFVAHLPPIDFTVKPTGVFHRAVEGLYPFEAHDEAYMLELSPGTQVLLESRYTGIAPEYYPREWLSDDPRPVMTYAPRGLGGVLYLSLGHSAGRFGMRPFLDEVEPVRCSWGSTMFEELIQRGIAWGVGRDDPMSAASA